jgi:hypothetical protein
MVGRFAAGPDAGLKPRSNPKSRGRGRGRGRGKSKSKCKSKCRGSVAGGRFTSHPSQRREGWGTRAFVVSGVWKDSVVPAVYIPPCERSQRGPRSRSARWMGHPQAWGMGAELSKHRFVAGETTALLPLNPRCYEPEHKDQANETCYADEDASGDLTLHNRNSLSNGTRCLVA